MWLAGKEIGRYFDRADTAALQDEAVKRLVSMLHLPFTVFPFTLYSINTPVWQHFTLHGPIINKYQRRLSAAQSRSLSPIFCFVFLYPRFFDFFPHNNLKFLMILSFFQKKIKRDWRGNGGGGGFWLITLPVVFQSGWSFLFHQRIKAESSSRDEARGNKAKIDSLAQYYSSFSLISILLHLSPTLRTQKILKNQKKK